jgi:site-specific recombinase XerD
MDAIALSPVPQTDLAALDERARSYAEAARADRTQRAYASDLAHFRRWTSAHGETWLPATPRTVAEYISELAETFRPSTIIRRVAAIAVYHQLAGVDSPTSHRIVKAVLIGIRRKLGVAQTQKADLSIAQIRAIIAATSDDLLGARDRALVLLGFAGALRRSELVGPRHRYLAAPSLDRRHLWR